jgi:hypothetical protein
VIRVIEGRWERKEKRDGRGRRKWKKGERKWRG